MRFFVITAPDEPAVSLVDMKAHLRVDHGDDDDQIEALTASAQAGFESPEMGTLGRPVAYQQIEMESDCGDRWPLRLFGPIDTDEDIEIVYRNSAGDDVTIDASSYRIERVDTFSPRLVQVFGWPYGNDIRVRAFVGLDSNDPRIGNFQSAIKLHVQTIYDGVEDRDRYRESIDSLLNPYRVLSI